jgi:uncharacterized protein YecE (DUF72 family)
MPNNKESLSLLWVMSNTIRIITPRSLELWKRFSNTLELMKDKIDFWLFQMPYNFKHISENMITVKTFFQCLVNNKTVLEFRDPTWWKEVKRIEKMGVVFCSVDAPCLPMK